MIVRNLQEEPHPPKCGCETWIHHWENNSGRRAGICSVLDCEKPADVGGHVQIIETDDKNLLLLQASKDNRWYIIPICTGHNLKYGEKYEVKPGTYPVSIEKTDSCGK
ncbi:MAG: hypothetical protein FWG29_04640 [Treponema sp.]|nr:hypothetical protein [Treponema sp.]